MLLIGVPMSFSLDARGQADGVPEWINYQGVLDFANGTPVSDMQDIEFRLYNNQDDSTSVAIWAELHRDVQMAGGVFNVYLGDGEAITGAGHDTLGQVLRKSGLWLGIKVGSGPEMTPRQQFLSVPYAMTAKYVIRATHGVPAGTIVAFAGPGYETNLDPPEGWLWCDGTSHSTTTSPDYQDLCDLLKGVTGETQFNVPDLRGRALIGAGMPVDNNLDSGTESAGLNTTVGYTAGGRTGQETHILTENEMPKHQHHFSDRYNHNPADTSDPGYRTDAQGYDVYGGLAGNLSQGYQDSLPKNSGDAGTDQGHNSIQPSVAMRWMIKY